MAITKTIEFKDEEYDVKIVIRRATIFDGILRASLQVHVGRELEGRPDKEGEVPELRLTLSLYSRYVYPACMSCIETLENNPEALKSMGANLSLDEFLGLPEPLVVAWEREVFKLNPSWEYPFRRGPEEADRGEEEEPSDKEP
jgi:hypothetical protein